MRLTYALLLGAALLPACTSDDKTRTNGQTTFQSAPLPRNAGLSEGAGGGDSNGGQPTDPGANQPPSTPREVEETDLYRLENNRLYYLNGYRGLMVFDVSDVDHPKLLGRSPIFGSPVDMIVRDGVATVVVADWYGTLDDGSPFYGSIVRGLDATDPAHIKNIGEAKLGGWVRDDRVVGDVLYAVSEDYGDEYYGWGWGCCFYGGGVSEGDGAGGGVVSPAVRARHGAHGRRHKTPTTAGDGTTTEITEQVIVSSVSFGNHQVSAVGKQSFPGYAGVFNVTPNSIMLAHQVGDYTLNQSELVYLDISDPNGAIVQRGKLTVNGTVDGWGADNGRWNLDFADGVTAHVIGERWNNTSGQTGYTLSIADFSNPDQPKLDATLDIPSPDWAVTARFDTNRLYLSPDSGWYDGTNLTPFQVYDLSDTSAPKLAGTIQIGGMVWNILPAPNSRIFALGEDYQNDSGSVSLQYIDASDPANPRLIGNSEFGEGWAWTPAAGTFKAFTMDATKGLVVLPFSGWSSTDDTYNNGLQLIQFTADSETTAGAAQTHGWVERGIFVGNRLVSLSDLSLSVVNYANPAAPTVVSELTLARNVVSAMPSGNTVAEVSSDWWWNDTTSSEVRVLPTAKADETTDVGNVPSVTVDGVGAQVFTNGNYAYIVTSVQTTTPCPGEPSDYNCYQRAQQVQVVDLSGGGAKLLGKIQLPLDPWDWYGWGWEGCFWFDWWDGGAIKQVDGSALAFRRWEPVYDSNGNYIDTNSKLYVVDASDPHNPSLASTTITDDGNAWWGDMQVVGSSLWTTHYEWVSDPSDQNGWVKYYIDRIDLSDRAHPAISSKVNVPGVLVGGDPTDPSIVYTIDYRWDSNNNTVDDFDILKIDGDTAELQSEIQMDGWVGNVFVSGKTAYLSSQIYYWNQPTGSDGAPPPPSVNLHAIDVSDPENPVDRIASGQEGWGWMLDVVGDRALVTSGWGEGGLDVYKLTPGQAPAYEQTVRTNGWGLNSASRQGNQLFLTSGYWGVQAVTLQ